MATRRVVTGKTATGRSVVVSDGPSSREVALQHVPGFICAPLWHEPAVPQLRCDRDPVCEARSFLPPLGGVTFMVITFPPDSVMMDPSFRPDLAGPEHAAASPGIAETFERDNPGMHTTPTMDFIIVQDGEIWLELDDGEITHLKKGDTVVQIGARHAWRNKGDKPATIAVVLVGANAPDSLEAQTSVQSKQ